MGRPGSKPTATPQLPPPTAALPIVAVPIPQLQTTPLPGALSTLPPATLPTQPQNVGLPPALVAEEPIVIDPDMTIEDLIDLRLVVGGKDPRYWAAHDQIQKKRDIIYEAHFNSQMKALQDLTIALYVVNKKKVPETVGKPFNKD